MYKKKSQGWMKHIDFIIIDLICLHISFVLAYYIRHRNFDLYYFQLYRNMAAVLFLIYILVIIFFETLKNVLKRNFYKEFEATVKQVCLVELVSTVYLFTIQGAMAYSRSVFYITGIIYAFLSFFTRLLWKSILKKRMYDGGKKSLVIITVEDSVQSIIRNIKNNNYDMFYIKGIAVLDNNLRGREMEGISVVANARTVVDYVCREWVDEVFIDIPEEKNYPHELIDQFAEMGVVVHVPLKRMSGLKRSKQLVEKIGNYTVLTTSISMATPLQLLTKRVMDILGGIVGCAITVVLCIFIAPVLWSQSPGPIFFKQIRIGKNGKKFKLYKFRSMYLDAEERKKDLLAENKMSNDLMFKVECDERIIGCKRMPDGTVKKGFGNFIREHSLDEWPQFFNVLKGDMSLVGTRPPTVDEWEKYELHHRARLAIKPGITGLWQVSGRSNIVDFEEVVELDTKYISEWSLWKDIKILLKTITVVWKKDGSI